MRGRPKGQANDRKSYGTLADLIRKKRLGRKLGLSDVARACKCSVQFISNIEHGRAPLPWDKAEAIANYLAIPLDEIQAANLSMRSDFKRLAGKRGSNKAGSDSLMMFTLAVQDPKLQQLVKRYQNAPAATRKRFQELANELMN